MKKSSVFVLMTVSAAFFFTACKKDKGSPGEEARVLSNLRNIAPLTGTGGAGTSKTTSDIETFDFRNDKNPYEWAGIAHNKALDYVAGYMSDLTDEKKSMTVLIKQPLTEDVTTKVITARKDKVIALTQKYVNENVAGKHDVDPGLTNAKEEEMSNSAIRYFTTNKYLDPRLSGLNDFNKDVWEKLTYLYTVGKLTDFEAHADSIIIAKIMETDDIQASIDIIKEAENTMLTASIEEKIKVHQLAFFSVLRNSIGYWSAVIQDPANPWWSLNKDLFTRIGTHTGYGRFSWHKFWGSVLEAVADGVGGLIGGAAGTAIGGPAGGVVGGIIVGAGCSGVVAAVYPD